MMEQFATEEQQVEAIKRFWKENGPALVIGAVIGLGGLWGWRYYNAQQIAAQEQASTGYQQAVESLQSESGHTQVAEFVSANADNGYGVLAALQLAKNAVQRRALPEAAKHLAFAADNAGESAIQSIANLRLARVQLELDQLDQALTTLDKVTDDAFAAQVQESKGDLYLRQQLFDKARAAYSAALEEDANNALLKMKLDNLAVAANG